MIELYRQLHELLSYEAPAFAGVLLYSRALTLFAMQLCFWTALKNRSWLLALSLFIPTLYYTDAIIAMHYFGVTDAPKLIRVASNFGLVGMSAWTFWTARRLRNAGV